MLPIFDVRCVHRPNPSMHMTGRDLVGLADRRFGLGTALRQYLVIKTDCINMMQLPVAWLGDATCEVALFCSTGIIVATSYN